MHRLHLSFRWLLLVALAAVGACTSHRQYSVAPPNGYYEATPQGMRSGGTVDRAPAVEGPFDEVWVIARRPDSRPRVSHDDVPGTGSMLVVEDGATRRAFPLQRTSVQAQLDGPIATVDVSQRFTNPYRDTIEAVYVFPLPDDAAVCDFVLRIGERKIRGVVREREEAERMYRDARSAGYVASLLTEERPNVFTERVANIEPGAVIDVELTYCNMLAYRDGWHEWRFPLVVGPRFNPPAADDALTTRTLRADERDGRDVSIDVAINAGTTMREITVPSHAIEPIVRDDGPSGQRARVRLSARDALPNKDFVLRYRVAGDAPTTGLVSTMQPDGTGTFALTIYPPREVTRGERAPVDVIYIIDRSGSMSGRPLEQVKDAVRESLSELRDDDRFQVVDFGSSGTSLGGTMLPVNASTIAQARRYVDALHANGGTMVLDGLRTALALPHEEGRVRYLVFMSDGFVGNEWEIVSSLQRELHDGRVFAFGVGSSANWHLMNGMARVGRGAVADLPLNADARDAMERFMASIAHPVMHDVALEWSGVEVTDVWPRRMPDLIAGRPVTIIGRYAGAGDARATIDGWIGAARVRVPVTLELARENVAPSLERIWARAKIAQLSDDAMRSDRGVASAEAEILQTALRYGIASPYTAFLAVDATHITRDVDRRTVEQPLAVPDGTRYETTVGPR